MNVVVIGGGFVGQLVQWAIPEARILDWRNRAPTDHLETRVGPRYLWEPIPGVPSKSFEVVTTIDGLPACPESILAYKKKVGKESDGGDWGLQFRHHTTGFHSQLPVPSIEFGKRVVEINHRSRLLWTGDNEMVNYDWLVSTIPLPALLDIFGSIHSTSFKSQVIYMTQTRDDSVEMGNAMWMNYISDPGTPIYRVTSLLQERFRESLVRIEPNSLKIMPGKIFTHPGSEQLISQLTSLRCQCFGRFGTWRPDELAHETWSHIVAWRDYIHG